MNYTYAQLLLVVALLPLASTKLVRSRTSLTDATGSTSAAASPGEIMRRRPLRHLKRGKGSGKGKGKGGGKGSRSKGSGKGEGGSYRVAQRQQPVYVPPPQPQVLPQVVYQVPQPVVPAIQPLRTPPAPVPVLSLPAPQTPTHGSFGSFFFRPATGGQTAPVTVTQQQSDPLVSPPLQIPSSTCSVEIECELLSGAPCSTLQLRDSNCEETVFYTITVCNIGPVDLQFSSADFNFDGFITDALAINQIAPSLGAGVCEVLDPNTEVNVCEEGTAQSSFSVSASPIGSSDLGLACEASASDSFSTSAPLAGGQARPQESFVGGSTWVSSSTWGGTFANRGGHWRRE